MAALREQNREQRSCESGADDRHRLAVILRGAHCSDLQRRDELPHFDERVVQRHGRNANDVRLAPIADEAASRERMEHLRAAVAERCRRSDNWHPRASGSFGVRMVSGPPAARATAIPDSRSAAAIWRAAPACLQLSNSASEASSGAAARIGGLEICQPSAPGSGCDPGGISKRLALSCPHQPARRTGRSRAHGAHGRSSRRSRRARIQILVAAPDGEIDVPIVQLEWHVADGVSEVETDATTCAARLLCDRAQIEALTVEKLNARQHHCRDLRAFALDQRQHVLGAHGFFAGPGSDFQHRARRVESMQADLRCDGIAVRRERMLLDEDLRALARRTIEVASIRCRFTVSVFIATTSSGCAPTRRASEGAKRS